MRVYGILSLITVLLLAGCASLPEKQESRVSLPDYEDAVRIKPEASAQYLRFSGGSVSRDGRTLRGIVDEVMIVRDEHNRVVDTVWVFRDLYSATPVSGRLAIPLRDIELLPALFPGMQTDSNNGINLVESFHITKGIPHVRQVPINRDPCAGAEAPEESDCGCMPFELGLQLSSSCSSREYSNVALAALLRGSVFSDGNQAVSEGKLGAGADVFAGYRWGIHRKWVTGLTLSTGISTVNAGDITLTNRKLDSIATSLRPLVLLTQRLYLVGFDNVPRDAIQEQASVHTAGTVIRYSNNVEIRCPDQQSSESSEPHIHSGARTTRDESPVVQRRTPAPGINDPEGDVYRWQRDSIVNEQILERRRSEPALDFFGGCIKPYIYGEPGVAVDAATQNAASMALNTGCNDCTATLRDANTNGALGVNWAFPVTFGFGLGFDMPISSLLDLELDLGYRSIAVGDSYARIGFSNVPDTRRISQFQLRIGVMY